VTKPNLLIFSGVLVSILALVLDGFELDQKVSEYVFSAGFIFALIGVVWLVILSDKSRLQTNYKSAVIRRTWLVGFLLCAITTISKKLFSLPDSIDILFSVGVGIFVLGIVLPQLGKLTGRDEKSS